MNLDRTELRGTLRWHLLLLVSLCALSGCRGSGRVELVSLSLKAIDPPAPQCTPIHMQECYWWIDQDGRVWVAMQRRQTPLLFPKLRFEFQLSLVVESLPAGRARNYHVNRNTLRGRVRLGPVEGRFDSRSGIMALYREGEDQLRGSMRLQSMRTVSEWLGGWGKPAPYLLLGSFKAIRDERRGRAIAELTESSGWTRDVPARAAVSSPSAPASSAPSPGIE